jgi:hypothetical protein
MMSIFFTHIPMLKKIQTQTVISENHRMTLSFKKLLKNVDEIDNWCQFHQHFTRLFHMKVFSAAFF